MSWVVEWKREAEGTAWKASNCTPQSTTRDVALASFKAHLVREKVAPMVAAIHTARLAEGMPVVVEYGSYDNEYRLVRQKL